MRTGTLYDSARDQLGVSDVVSKIRLMNKHYQKKAKELENSK